MYSGYNGTNQEDWSNQYPDYPHSGFLSSADYNSAVNSSQDHSQNAIPQHMGPPCQLPEFSQPPLQWGSTQSTSAIDIF